eukprot:CAMPEP_0170561324 /NCGR_PEP_ID=MMETSP0211-20121228/54121_1 /TAXON_ID=311385 /ORGANISM="Pseudokeronopsis sp., Strain OXSARD2" /LENGTH=62 /DNA_ID=CAMNT_0010876707 /DNA_START=211 /DNA_END=399 /DNA_ORIENTATION=-
MILWFPLILPIELMRGMGNSSMRNAYMSNAGMNIHGVRNVGMYAGMENAGVCSFQGGMDLSK